MALLVMLTKQQLPLVLIRANFPSAHVYPTLLYIYMYHSCYTHFNSCGIPLKALGGLHKED